MNRQRVILILWLLTLLIVGCSGDSDTGATLIGDLPTRAALPTNDPDFVASSDANQLAITQSGAMTLPATFTPTVTTTTSETATITPSSTITETPSPTPTDTPPSTPTASPTQPASPLNSLVEAALNFTPFPSNLLGGSTPTLSAITIPTPSGGGALATPLPATSCQFLPPGGFGTAIINDPNLILQVGCPVGSPPIVASLSSAVQNFQNGQMLWLDASPGNIYVFYNNGTFQRFNDTYNAAVDPVSGGETPPAGLFEPVRGFGKVWRENASVRNALGWAIGSEQGTQTVSLDFDRGRMLSTPVRGDIVILVYQNGNIILGAWRAVVGQF